jgi:hypothetical protein
MGANIGPTANLPGFTRRSGRSGSVWEDGRMAGEVIQVEWNVAIQQIPVVIAGAWRTDHKPGGEERAGTFRVQDIHDKWALRVYNFLVARREGNRAAAAFPEFSVVTKLDDIGAPDETRWQLDGCQLFQYAGGHNQEDDLIVREIPFTFRSERPLHAFEYTDNGIAVTED